MAEQLDLTTPVTGPTLTYYKVVRLVLDREESTIHVTLKGTNGERLTHSYGGSVALTLINQLNVANMAVKSLEKRTLEQLVTDGVIAGTISGSPD